MHSYELDCNSYFEFVFTGYFFSSPLFKGGRCQIGITIFEKSSNISKKFKFRAPVLHTKIYKNFGHIKRFRGNFTMHVRMYTYKGIPSSG